MAIPALLDELLRAPGPPGAEEAVAAVVRREAAAFAELESDVLGSTIARVRGTDGRRTLALFAHVDQVGMIVTHVDVRGLLHVSALGDWSAAAAVGQRVAVVTSKGLVPGVAHREGVEGAPRWPDVRIDVGARDADHARSLAGPGDAAVLVSSPVELTGGRVAGVALDDRVGLYASLQALRRIAADPPAWDVALVASTQEEGETRGGALAVAERIRPDVAVVVEVTYSADEPGRDPGTWGNTSLGAGAAVFRGPVAHPTVVEGLLAVAQREGIPTVVEAGQSTWSDCDDVFAAAGGIPATLVSIPLRYMHSASEVVDLADVEAVSRLLEAYARSLDEHVSFVR